MFKLGQIFYGRSKDGYGILGASPIGRSYVGFVAALCRAVGSPDRPGDIQPFLISKREGGNVIMIRACRGDADPTGRSTLFFHALVAPAEELASANLDAFALEGKDVFLSSLPKSVEDIEVAMSASSGEALPSGDLRFPAFVSADRPLDAEVRRALGREALTRNWATYSYRPLDGFDLCVHSSYASSPTSGNRYALENGRFVAVDGPRDAPPTPRQSSHVKDSSPMLKASLFANAVLVIGIAAFLAMRNGGDGGGEHPSQMPSKAQIDQSNRQSVKHPPEMTKESAFEKWGKEWESEFRRQLRASFEKRLGGKSRILDFDKEMLWVDPYYEDYKNGKARPPTDQTLAEFSILKVYVSFIENEILTTKQAKEEP